MGGLYNPISDGLESLPAEEKVICEEYLGFSNASITQPQMWYLLRAFGKQLGHEILAHEPVVVDFLNEFQEADGPASLWLPTGGNWEIQSNIYKQTWQHDLPYFSAAGEFDWQDYIYEADVRADSGGYVGICARFSSIEQAYLFYLRIGSGNCRLAKAPFNTLVETAGGSLSLSQGTWYRLKMELDGKKIKCYVDGQLQISHTDPSEIVAGKIGLWCYWTAISCKYAKAWSD